MIPPVYHHSGGSAHSKHCINGIRGPKWLHTRTPDVLSCLFSPFVADFDLLHIRQQYQVRGVGHRVAQGEFPGPAQPGRPTHICQIFLKRADAKLRLFEHCSVMISSTCPQCPIRPWCHVGAALSPIAIRILADSEKASHLKEIIYASKCLAAAPQAPGAKGSGRGRDR